MADIEQNTALEVSESTRQVLKEAMKPFDRNEDSVLDLGELRECLECIGCYVTSDDDLKFLRAKLDKNGDGKLTLDELIDNIATINAHSLNGDELRKSFQMIDKSGNGYITREELRLVLMAPGPHQMSETEAREQVDILETRFDVNKDGRIDYGEFVQMWLSSDPLSCQSHEQIRPPSN